ncbi:hypothetical protein J4Q44_G00031100 [Coregonus suidteri]|uniref:Uncharacterized protein n=1 Tax=Coregonus suidteri TaxID=861788 RepID=A0AAN8M9V3_9TELE
MPESLELTEVYARYHRLLIIGNFTASLSSQHQKALGRFQKRLPRVLLDQRPKGNWREWRRNWSKIGGLPPWKPHHPTAEVQ